MTKPKSEYRAARRAAKKAEEPGFMRRMKRRSHVTKFEPNWFAFGFKRDGEKARHLRQIEAGQLRAENGLSA